MRRNAFKVSINGNAKIIVFDGLSTQDVHLIWFAKQRLTLFQYAAIVHKLCKYSQEEKNPASEKMKFKRIENEEHNLT